MTKTSLRLCLLMNVELTLHGRDSSVQVNMTEQSGAKGKFLIL